jgi:serine/threonine-protein kinase HipA
MKYCPITYEPIEDQANYSKHGLRRLSPQLKNLEPLLLSATEQREQAIVCVGKMSIQGVQSKLSAVLKIKEARFELVDQHGQYILKPQSEYYPELPENEAITMSLAETIGIEIPVHGLVYSKDNTMTYFIKRFDRNGRSNKLAVEDAAQLLQFGRDTKYKSSMEQVVKMLFDFCSFPRIEAVQLFKRILFNFLTGNEDMHLKNFSLITHNQKITLSPAYDLLNTTIAQKNTAEEIALPLNGKKNNLRKNDFLDYFADRLQLNQVIIADVMQEIRQALPQWKILISHSFLSAAMQEKYIKVLDERCARLGLG